MIHSFKIVNDIYFWFVFESNLEGLEKTFFKVKQFFNFSKMIFKLNLF